MKQSIEVTHIMSRTQDLWQWEPRGRAFDGRPDEGLTGWSAGIDAVTLTKPESDDASYDMWRGKCAAVVAELYDGEFEERRALLRGYEGVRLHPDLFIGRLAGQGCLISVTGAMALGVVACIDDAANCSRLDVQVTVHRTVDPQVVIDRVFAECVHRRDNPVKKGRPYRVRHEVTAGEGDTVYIGARTSMLFGRVYDKQRQSKEVLYEGAVRYEVELKDAASWRAYNQLKVRGDRWYLAVQIVYACMASWGIAMPEQLCMLAPRIPSVIRQPFEADRTLEWLRTQVAPSIDKLVAHGVTIDAINLVLFGRVFA